MPLKLNHSGVLFLLLQECLREVCLLNLRIKIFLYFKEIFCYFDDYFCSKYFLCFSTNVIYLIIRPHLSSICIYYLWAASSFVFRSSMICSKHSFGIWFLHCLFLPSVSMLKYTMTLFVFLNFLLNSLSSLIMSISYIISLLFKFISYLTSSFHKTVLPKIILNFPGDHTQKEVLHLLLAIFVPTLIRNLFNLEWIQVF